MLNLIKDDSERGRRLMCALVQHLIKKDKTFPYILSQYFEEYREELETVFPTLKPYVDDLNARSNL